jgi:hypothetical protein
MDLPPDEHRILITLPFGNQVEIETGGLKIVIRGGAKTEGKWLSVEIESSPDVRLAIAAEALRLGDHPPDEGDSVRVVALLRKEDEP